MSEERFVDSEADDFERSLLSSARRDGISPAKKRALAVALGVGAATISMAPAAAGAAGAAKAGTAAAVKAKGAFGLAAIGKWVIGLAVTSAVVAGATKGVFLGEPTAPLVRSAPEPPPLPSPSARGAFAQSANAGELRGASGVARSQPTEMRPSEPAPVTPSLAEELRAIDRARTALAAGDLREASRALDAHDAAFPTGSFSDESRVMRIDLLARSGDRKGAEQQARAFLAARPRSPHAPRVRALLGESP